MRVGYARVSTPDQSFAPQLDALEHSGCGKIFQEVASGAKADRVILNAALDDLRPGDTWWCGVSTVWGDPSDSSSR